jgi:hypothetical protein
MLDGASLYRANEESILVIQTTPMASARYWARSHTLIKSAKTVLCAHLIAKGGSMKAT